MISSLHARRDKTNMVTSSFLGSLLLHADTHHQKLVKSKEVKKTNKGYKLRYPRTLTTFLKLNKAIEIMRYTYKFSIGNIGSGLQISTRTVKNYIDNMKRNGRPGINLRRFRYRIRSKHSSFSRRLRFIAARIQSYIDGQFDLLTLYSRLGLEPP